MDILDILLDILLKPPQPFIGLFFNYFILGYFWPKTGVGQTSPEWVQTDPDESSLPAVLCDITDITEGAKM